MEERAERDDSEQLTGSALAPSATATVAADALLIFLPLLCSSHLCILDGVLDLLLDLIAAGGQDRFSNAWAEGKQSGG